MHRQSRTVEISRHQPSPTGFMTMKKENKLKLAIAMSSGFLLIEVVGAYLANSLAIYSDAAHLLTDIAGFAISLLAVIAARRSGCKDYTYGMVRAEVFGALASILSLWVITAILVYEAYYRGLAWFDGDAPYVNGKLMFFVAVFGVIVNICLGFVFSSEHGGAFHPAHSHGGHDHGHSCGDHGHEPHKDKEVPSDHGHDHGHDNTKQAVACTSDHDHGHGHGAHSKSSESSSLVAGAQKNGYSQISSHDEETGHGHGHSHAPAPSSNGHGHDHSSNGAHALQDDDHHDSHTSTKPHSEGYDANIQAAYLHVLTDLIQSIGVAIAGLVIWMKPEWQIIDPLCTLMFSILVLHFTMPLIHKIANVLLEGKPEHIDWHQLESRLKKIEGVQDVHDLHVWSISSNTCAMTVHVRAYNPQEVLVEAHKVCKDMSIQHATIQVQDAAAGNKQECLSDMCVVEGTCVGATPSIYQFHGV